MYTSKELVIRLYPHINIEQMGWMIDNLDSYAVATTYLGWQFSKNGQYFRKTPTGWIECRIDGTPILRLVVNQLGIVNDYQTRIISRRS